MTLIQQNKKLFDNLAFVWDKSKTESDLCDQILLDFLKKILLIEDFTGSFFYFFRQIQ